MKVAETTRIAVRGKVIEQNVGQDQIGVKVATGAQWSTPGSARGERAAGGEKKNGGKWLGGDDGCRPTQQNGRPTSPRTLDSWWRDSLVAAGVPAPAVARGQAHDGVVAHSDGEIMGRSEPCGLGIPTAVSWCICGRYSMCTRTICVMSRRRWITRKERVMPEDRGPVHPLQEEIPPRLLAEMGIPR